MTQSFEIFKGDPAGLVKRLEAIRDDEAGVVLSVTLTTAAANYLIIWEA